MYEDMIAALMQDMQVDMPSARASALRAPPGPTPAPMGPNPGQGLMPPPSMPVQTPMPIPDVPTGPPGPVPGPQATQPLPGPQSPSQRPPGPSGGPMLPKALAASQPPMAPPAPIPDVPDPMEQRQQQLMQQYQQAMAPPDRGPMEAAYKARAQEGPRMLLHALAAERAGKQGLAKSYYQQAGEVDQPMRMAGGTMTPTGFIEDPDHAREFQLKKIEAQITQNDRIINSNAVRKDKIAAEQRNADLRREMQQNQIEMQRGIAAQSSADRRFAAGLAHEDRVAAAGAKTNKPTESMMSAAGYLGRMEAVEGQIDTLSKTGKPSLLTKSLGQFGLGRAARPYLESTDQQKYRAVQEDWVRAKLRKESGASIPPDEMEREIETYFPQPGETDPEVVRIKAQARAQAAEQLRTSAGTVEPTTAAPVGGGAPAAPAAAQPVRVNTPAEAAKLPPGTRFVTPDGQTRVRQ